MKLPWRYVWVVAVLTAACLLLAACGEEEEAATLATPTATPKAMASPEATPTPEGTPTPEPTPTPELMPEETPTPEPEDAYEGWLTYTSDAYGYELRYPPGAEISEAPKEAFALPTEESEAGVTVEDIYSSYTGQICVRVMHDLGYVAISAPPNEGGFRYVICLRSGVGTCPPPNAQETEFIERQETLVIDGRTYTATGFERQCPGETLMDDNEMLRVSLEDGTTIEYGTRPSQTATYEDYLQIRDVLLKIVQSYRELP